MSEIFKRNVCVEIEGELVGRYIRKRMGNYSCWRSDRRSLFCKISRPKAFLKRNSSPFLAVLSAEGIVPKLVWTRRMENGDVITAQHWLDGRELKPKDMNSSRVTELLSKIHHSNELLDMLKRLGKTYFFPKTC